MKRLLIMSLRGISPHPSRCGIFEFEDVLGQLEEAHFCVPQLPAAPEPGRLLHYVGRALERSVALSLTRAQQPLPDAVEEPCELGLFFCQSVMDLKYLQAMPGWRRHCRRAICWIDELWLHTITQHGKALAPLREFDAVVCTMRQPVEALQQLIERPCFHLPQGVDCLRFCPYPDPPPRSIDVYYMGRRGPATHQALMELSRQRAIHYVYDSMRANLVLDVQEHRELVTSYIQRARYFFVQSAKANLPDQKRGQQEVASRYFEGCAGGAILVGEIPSSPTVAEYLDWPDAILEFPFNSEHIAAFLEGLEAQPERRAAIHRRNVIQALRRHDWSHRWQALLERLQVEPPPRLTARQQKLSQRAQAIDESADNSQLGHRPRLQSADR